MRILQAYSSIIIQTKYVFRMVLKCRFVGSLFLCLIASFDVMPGATYLCDMCYNIALQLMYIVTITPVAYYTCL